MQPIIVLAIVGVAAVAMGTGFLGNPIDLSMVQLIGVGETDLKSPITKANIDFVIARDSDVDNGMTKFRNVIAACIVEPNSGHIEKGSTVFCKLTDANDNVIAEGITQLSKDVWANMEGSTFRVPIGTTSFVFANDVTEVHDIILVILGPSMTGN